MTGVRILNLQDLEVESVETPAETYQSTNSAYACLMTSTHSMAC